MNPEKVGRFINQIRIEKKLTQEELAKKINVTNKAISRWERGLGLPDISLLEPLSKELNVSISELLNGEYLGKHDLMRKRDIHLLLGYSIKINPISENEIILKLNIFLTFFILLIFYITFRFQGYDNTYFFKLFNSVLLVPFGNFYSGLLTKNFFPFFYNLILNFIIAIFINTYIFYIVKNKRKRLKIIILINLFLEGIKWITLLGIFDINDILIRIGSYFFLSLIYKILKGKKFLHS